MWVSARFSAFLPLYSDEFESAFSDFLERYEYDEAENYLLSMVRLFFAAGWLAAHFL